MMRKLFGSKKGLDFKKLAKWLLVLIGLVIVAVIISSQLWKGGSQVGSLSACNNQFQMCACLLYPMLSVDANVVLECPPGSVQIDHSESCPQKCSADTFEQNLKDAKDAFKSTKDKKMSFGHCCRGEFEGWEAD